MAESNWLFSAKLYALFKASGLETQKQLAELIKVSENAITKYMHGARVPEWDILVRIAHYFEVSIDWLLMDIEIESMKLSGNAQLTIGTGGIPEYRENEKIDFKDAQRAYKAIKDLALIEREAPGEYGWLWEKIHGKADWLRDEEKKLKKAT